MNLKNYKFLDLIIAASLAVALVLSLYKCKKEEDIVPNTQSESLRVAAPAQSLPVNWTRYLYVDKTDTTNFTVLSRYCRQNKIQGIYFYSTSNIIDNQSNWSSWSDKMKLLSDSGVSVRAVIMGSPSRILSSGSVTRYNRAQTDSSRLVNRYNQENEFWNNASTFSNWISNQQTIWSARNTSDFYMGWFKNLGGTVDTIAAREMVRYSSRVLLHAYQPNMPSGSYIRSRLEVLAKGGRQINKKVRLYIIVSAEQKAWGANNDFSGNSLRSYGSFTAFENVLYTNLIQSGINQIPADLRQWIEPAGVIYFTKRYVYRAIPPR